MHVAYHPKLCPVRDATQYNYKCKIILDWVSAVQHHFLSTSKSCSSPLPPTRHHAKYGLVDTICNTNFVLFYRGVSVFLSKICSSHTQLAIDGLHVASLDELYHTSIQKQLLKMINQCWISVNKSTTILDAWCYLVANYCRYSWTIMLCREGGKYWWRNKTHCSNPLGTQDWFQANLNPRGWFQSNWSP